MNHMSVSHLRCCGCNVRLKPKLCRLNWHLFCKIGKTGFWANLFLSDAGGLLTFFKNQSGPLSLNQVPTHLLQAKVTTVAQVPASCLLLFLFPAFQARSNIWSQHWKLQGEKFVGRKTVMLPTVKTAFQMFPPRAAVPPDLLYTSDCFFVRTTPAHPGGMPSTDLVMIRNTCAGLYVTNINPPNHYNQIRIRGKNGITPD